MRDIFNFGTLFRSAEEIPGNIPLYLNSLYKFSQPKFSRHSTSTKVYWCLSQPQPNQICAHIVLSAMEFRIDISPLWTIAMKAE